MYSVVYSLIDNEELKYFNEMMVSIYSLKYRMPELKIYIVTDLDTVNNIKSNSTCYMEACKESEFIIVDIPLQYSQKEKSRYLKTSLRKYVSGDFLFIDTDTIICEAFPENISNADIAMALDYNVNISERLDKAGVRALNEICGTPIGETEEYFNTGVIWVKDSLGAYKFYEEWHTLWEISMQSGLPYDQPTANKILRKKEIQMDTLDGSWNCQVSVNPSPLKYIHTAKIIHYYNSPGSPYLMCKKNIKCEGYQGKTIDAIIKNPKSMFGKTVTFSLDGYEDLYSSKVFKLINLIYDNKRSFFNFIEKTLGIVNSVKKIVK